MTEPKKTILINPDFLKLPMKGNRTKKNRDNAVAKPIKIRSDKRIDSDKTIRRKALNYIRAQQEARYKRLMNGVDDDSASGHRVEIKGGKTYADEFKSEFDDSLALLQKLADQNEQKMQVQNATLRQYPPIVPNSTLFQSPVLDKILDAPTTNLPPFHLMKPAYGCLKGGTLPTYRTLKSQNGLPNISANISNNNTDVFSKGDGNGYSSSPSNTAVGGGSSPSNTAVGGGNGYSSSPSNTAVGGGNGSSPSNTAVGGGYSSSLSNTAVSGDSLGQSPSPQQIGAARLPRLTPEQQRSELKQFLEKRKEEKQRVERVKRQRNLVNPVKKQKRTTTRTFRVGKSKHYPRVGVLIPNKTIRTQVLARKQKIRETPLEDIRKYLIKKGLIRVGSSCPNDVLRQMYESSMMMCGEIQNHNPDNLLYNYLHNGI